MHTNNWFCFSHWCFWAKRNLNQHRWLFM